MRCGHYWLQSRATAGQAEKKTRQLEKVIDDGEQKLSELLDELKDAHDEERRMNAEITKLRLQLDETSSATDFAKKDCKKLSGSMSSAALNLPLTIYIYFLIFRRDVFSLLYCSFSVFHSVMPTIICTFVELTWYYNETVYGEINDNIIHFLKIHTKTVHSVDMHSPTRRRKSIGFTQPYAQLPWVQGRPVPQLLRL